MSVAGYRAEVVQTLGNSLPFAGTIATPEFAPAVRASDERWSIDPASRPTGQRTDYFDAWHASSRLDITYDFSRQVVIPYPVAYTRTWEYNQATTADPAAMGEYSFGAGRTWTIVRNSTSLELYSTDANALARGAEFADIPVGAYLRYVSPNGSEALFRTTADVAVAANVATIAIVLVRADTPGQTIPTGVNGAQFQWLDDAEFAEYDAAQQTLTVNANGEFAFATTGTPSVVITNNAGLRATDNLILHIRVGDTNNHPRGDTIGSLEAGDYVILIQNSATWFAFEVVAGDQAGDTRDLTVRYIHDVAAAGGDYTSAASFIFLKGDLFNSENHISYPYVEVNRLFGWLTVFGTTADTPLRIRGQFLPKQLLAGANSFTLSLSNELLDDTDFGSRGWMSRIVGLHNAGLSISRYEQESEAFRNILLENQDEDVLVEITPASDVAGVVGRGYFKIGTSDRSGEVNSLETTDLEYELNVYEDPETDRFVGFIWSDED